MTRHPRPSRRRFLGTLTGTAATAAAGRLAAAPATELLSRPDQAPVLANDRVQVGLIGAGIQGVADTDAALPVPGTKLVAVCDLYTGRLAQATAKRGADLFTTRDYRELLARPDVDAVIIATPDHWHRQISVDAFEARKPAYCEKPMVQRLGEGDAIIAAQKKTGVVFQVGSQGLSSVGNEKARELRAAGAIGSLVYENGR